MTRFCLRGHSCRRRSMIPLFALTAVVTAGQALGQDGPDDCAFPCDDVFAIRFPNALKTEYFFNALSANPITLPELTASALNSDTFADGGDPLLRVPLHDPFARRFMAYLVRCSLPPTTQVSWADPFDGVSYSWTGEAGLCPDWNIGPPTGQCLRRVSACLLARNNYFGIAVEVSVRGANSGPFPGGDPPVTVTEEITRDPPYLPVPSFSPCASPQSGMFRNCGWTPDFAGECAPFTRVQIGAGGVPADPTCGGCSACPSVGTQDTPRLVLRVCSGLDGCDFPARVLAQDDGACPTSPDQAPAVGFDCPAEGFFSVMTAPYDSDGNGSGTNASAPGTAIFPVPQYLAYAIREATFYGNLFDPALLDPGVDVEVNAAGEVIGREQSLRVPRAFHGASTCYDSDWTVAQAYAYHRVCAAPSGGDPTTSTGCVAHVVGACSDYPSGQQYMCQFDRRGLSPPFYDDWEHCFDEGGTAWSETISVFLHGANDIVCPQGQLSDFCQRLPH